MSLVNSIRSSLREFLGLPGETYRSSADYYNLYGGYRLGNMRSVFKQKPGQPDFNIVIPQVRQIQDRSVSFLLGEGVEFDFGEGEETQDDYISMTWQKNATAQTDAVLLGAVFGTSIVKIVPQHFKVGGVLYPRFIPMNPVFFSGDDGGIDTDPEDKDLVIAYRNHFLVEYDGKPYERLEVSERKVINAGQYPPEYAETWTVTNYIKSRDTGNKYAVLNEAEWPYSFPPYHHWQNLRNPLGVYGEPDVDIDALVLNDKENMVAGNTLKIIMMQAHPTKYTIGARLPDEVDMGPDAIWQFTSPDVKVGVLEGANDLASSQKFLETLRQIMFSSTRTVDISSMADKVGALTNFGLRVLFMDEMNKCKTKRQLTGAGLAELNRRALVIAGFPDDVDGGTPLWADPLPINGMEQAQEIQIDLGMGIVDKQTASETRGYDWETVKTRLEEEQGSETNLGDRMLRDFMQGAGAEQGQALPVEQTAPIEAGAE
jgi:hypothetical protein